MGRLAGALSRYQEESTGAWYQVVDQAGRAGNYLESSASCMFVCSLLKAVRLGVIDSRYLSVAVKGYEGILGQFISENPDGTITLNRTCLTAGLGNGRDGSYGYYVYQTQISQNDGKAMGPFILASLEMEALSNQPVTPPDPDSPAFFTVHAFPNPFNAVVQINYALPRTGRVRVEVFNAMGSQTALLTDCVQSDGPHRISWNASGTHAGVYFLVVTNTRERLVKKMTVLK
jgi:hypothetical protein